ncbi:hypothetical protein J4204_04500 [Candidatus Woesearchaeota archaeon]|nr:hypothetical protein [Candidatus Woesearchaeota archaeon]
MQFANYFSASIISFSGLLIGIMLARIAPEEQKPLEKYFLQGRKALLLAIFAFLAFYYFNNYFNLLVLLAYLIFLLLIEYKLKDLFKKNIVVYALLGVLFYLSSKNTNLFAIESSLMLLYGMPTASLMYSRKEKNEYRIIFYNIGFVILADLLYFI